MKIDIHTGKVEGFLTELKISEMKNILILLVVLGMAYGAELRGQGEILISFDTKLNLGCCYGCYPADRDDTRLTLPVKVIIYRMSAGSVYGILSFNYEGESYAKVIKAEYLGEGDGESDDYSANHAEGFTKLSKTISERVYKTQITGEGSIYGPTHKIHWSFQFELVGANFCPTA